MVFFAATTLWGSCSG